MLTPVSNEAFKAASNEASRICAELHRQETAYDDFLTGQPDVAFVPGFQRCSDHLLSL